MWILVFYGKREREKLRGHVADFCPVCRKIRAFGVLEIRVAMHIYFIPLERGNFLEHRRKCRACHTVLPCHLGQYNAVSKAEGASLERLIQETFPSIHEVYQERLALEAQIAPGGSQPDAKLRMQVLMEAFHLAHPHFENGFGQEGRRILAQALRPLRPTEQEIRECLQFFREHRTRMGAKVRTADVMNSIYPGQKPTTPGQFDY